MTLHPAEQPEYEESESLGESVASFSMLSVIRHVLWLLFVLVFDSVSVFLPNVPIHLLMIDG